MTNSIIKLIHAIKMYEVSCDTQSAHDIINIPWCEMNIFYSSILCIIKIYTLLVQ